MQSEQTDCKQSLKIGKLRALNVQGDFLGPPHGTTTRSLFLIVFYPLLSITTAFSIAA